MTSLSFVANVRKVFGVHCVHCVHCIHCVNCDLRLLCIHRYICATFNGSTALSRSTDDVNFEQAVSFHGIKGLDKKGPDTAWH
jgi:hypothetical protein